MTYLPRKGERVTAHVPEFEVYRLHADEDGQVTGVVAIGDESLCVQLPPGTIFEPVDPSWFPPQRGDVAADADGRVAIAYTGTRSKPVAWEELAANGASLPDFRPVELLARDGKRVRS